MNISISKITVINDTAPRCLFELSIFEVIVLPYAYYCTQCMNVAKLLTALVRVTTGGFPLAIGIVFVLEILLIIGVYIQSRKRDSDFE
jgi:hypothetical protein